ncbi:MAG: DUF4282 domain-containing protein [Candidatus Hydrogenedentes bacterium]|nr:DUF4282 domain-containing protein [Candidatus Hydrogenedentota bacterium]
MENKGFFAGLFDFSFSEFITVRLIPVIYFISLLGAALGALGVFISAAATKSVGAILISLVMAPAAFFLSVLLTRIWLEMLIVVFRIAENTGRLVEQGDERSGRMA